VEILGANFTKKNREKMAKYSSQILLEINRFCTDLTTGSPSSKNEHQQASALLRNIQNIRICMGKNLWFW